MSLRRAGFLLRTASGTSSSEELIYTRRVAMNGKIKALVNGDAKYAIGWWGLIVVGGWLTARFFPFKRK